MEQNLQKVIEKRIERTMEALRKNRMEAYYVKTKEEVVPLIEQLCQPGENVAAGGSVTLAECGVMAHLASGRYNFWDSTSIIFYFKNHMLMPDIYPKHYKTHVFGVHYSIIQQIHNDLLYQNRIHRNKDNFLRNFNL